jgi:hypothetical protein
MRVSPRGRAILELLPAEAANERTYRPGDFVLTRSKGSLAWSLGAATASRLNQAALIVDSSGGLIEVNPAFITSEGGLRRSHINEYLERGAPVWVGYVELLDGTRSEVVRFAEQMLEEQRGFTEWQFAGLLLHVGMSIAPRHLTGKYRVLRLLHGLFDHHALVIKEENIFTSAELVARALERGGFVWGKDPAHITPADLFERFCPPGRVQELKQAALPSAHTTRSRAAAYSGGVGRLERDGTDEEEVEPLHEATGEEAVVPAAMSDAPTVRSQHPQEEVVWGIGALALGGFMVALGLGVGWAARALGLRAG